MVALGGTRTLSLPTRRPRSRLRRPPLRSGELCDLPARIRSVIPRLAKIIPCIFRILELPCDCPHPAGDGPCPVRAGSCLALGLWPEGVQRLRRSRVGPEDHFCEAVRNDLRVPLKAEGHPRTLSGPFPDLSPASTLASSTRLLTGHLFPACTVGLGIRTDRGQ